MTQRYFVLQVGQKGSNTLLNYDYYRHIGWQDTPKDADHGKVSVGDVVFVYFTNSAVNHKGSLQKSYKVMRLIDGNDKFLMRDLGITLNEIITASIHGELRSEAFGRLGQQGFNIKEIKKEDVGQLLFLFLSLQDRKIVEEKTVS